MKKLLSYLFIMFIGCSVYGQSRDSTQVWTFSGDGAHNGYCCGHWEESYTMVWSYKRKQWSLFNDSVIDAMNLNSDTAKPKVFYGIAGVKKEPIDSSKIFWKLYVKNKQRGIPDSLNKYYIKLKKQNVWIQKLKTLR